jgi:predicted RNA-binding protein with PUA-like domain
MALWLFKEEPEHYPFARLEHEGETTWDGVSNPQALGFLRQVRRGDRIWFYATGKIKAIVGEMTAVADAQTVRQGKGDTVVVRVRAVRPVKPVTLARIKKERSLAGWQLVKLPRLSVMPVTESRWRRVEELMGEAT